MKADWVRLTVRKRSFVSSPAERCLLLPLQFSHHYELSFEAGLRLTGKIRHYHFHNIQISTVRNIEEFSMLSLFSLFLKDKLSLHHVLAVNIHIVSVSTSAKTERRSLLHCPRPVMLQYLFTRCCCVEERE